MLEYLVPELIAGICRASVLVSKKARAYRNLNAFV